MRELALLVFDVATALLLFIVGSGSISLLGQTSLVPIGLLPFALWLKWRVPLRDWTYWRIITYCLGFAIFFFVWEHLSPFKNSDWRDLLQFPLLLFVMAIATCVKRSWWDSGRPTP